MIDPIGSNPTAITSNAAQLTAERSAQQLGAAVRVPRADEAHANGSSTSQSQANIPHDSSPGAQRSTIENALEQVNNNLEAWSTGMRFDIDEDAQRVVISIIDTGTGEVLRTVPSDAVLRVAKMIVQLQGTVVNTKA